ncbi:hypothetical protein ACWIGW_06820 [Nocardia brasiliensis]
MTSTVTSFTDLETEFDDFVGHIGYATMVTVDRRNRPRTRVLIPIWENVDGVPVILRLDPWRIQVIRGRDLRSRIWQAPEPAERAAG